MKTYLYYFLKFTLAFTGALLVLEFNNKFMETVGLILIVLGNFLNIYFVEN